MQQKTLNTRPFLFFWRPVKFPLECYTKKEKIQVWKHRYRYCHLPTFQVNVRILPSVAELPRLHSCALQFTHICPPYSSQNSGTTLQHWAAVCISFLDMYTVYQHSPCSAYWSVGKGPLKGMQWCVALSESDTEGKQQACWRKWPMKIARINYIRELWGCVLVKR